MKTTAKKFSQLNQKDILAFIEIKQKLKAKIEDIEKQNIEYATNAMVLIEKHNIDLNLFCRTFPESSAQHHQREF